MESDQREAFSTFQRPILILAQSLRSTHPTKRPNPASMPWKQRRELGPQLRPQIGAHIDNDRKVLVELLFVRDAGIDQDTVVEISWQIKRITLRSPGLLDQVDIGHRVEPRAHRPQHLVEIAGI